MTESAPSAAPSATAAPVDALWDIEQVSALLRLHAKTTARMFRLRQIPGGVRIGARIVRFRPEVIRQWIEQGCQPQPTARAKKGAASN